jgi:hypothetical protein
MASGPAVPLPASLTASSDRPDAIPIGRGASASGAPPSPNSVIDVVPGTGESAAISPLSRILATT